jgi:hypothetical protein
MSEYQFYEFKAIDKPLSEKDRNEIGNWSSRTNPSNTGATFTYSYGSFPKDEIKVLEKYFDAMFYIANWGTTQLVFKLPNNLIDIKQLKQYCIMDGLDVIEKPDFILVNICISDEEGGGEWIEGEGWMSTLASLRNDILSGDYRCLYLIWLKVSTEDVLSEWGNIDSESSEPEVPGNLKSLNGALMDFVDIFEIDKDAITVSSEKSRTDSSEKSQEYANYINRLPNDEKDKLLLRLLKNEPLLNISLKNRLKDFVSEVKERGIEKRRTVGELVQAIREVKEQKKIEKKRKREEKRLTKLKKTEQQEMDLWATVELLIKEKKTKSYEEAIKTLQDLKALAIHKNRFEDFRQKIETIQQKYSRLSGLQWRISEGNLTGK